MLRRAADLPESLLTRLLDELPGGDVRIVADPALRKPRERGEDSAVRAGSTTVGGEHPHADMPAAGLAPRTD